MPTASADVPPSPWLSVWFRPRQTIERIVAANPRRQVWLLASLGLICSTVLQLLLAGWISVLLDWRAGAALVVGGAIAGIVSLYYSSLFFRWSGRLFGGQASRAHIRAALAWGQLPAILGLVLCLAVVLVLKLLGADRSSAETLTAVFVAIAAATGLWSLIMTWHMLGRVQGLGFWRGAISAVLGWLAAWLIAATFLAVLLRTLLFQPFNIPSGSMTPTLQIGDYLFVAKYAYGYTHYSLPFSPALFSGRIFGAEPQRGDVVVYRLPTDDRVDYISRIVGLPGDRIQMVNGQLHINGEPVKRERIGDFAMKQNGQTVGVKRWRETLPNGVSHETLDLQERGFLDNTQEYTVPPGHYFMMGDNRDNATDSRVLSRVGYVPFENLIGRAALIFASVVPDPQSGEPNVSLHRFGLVR
jgi:signal peptidase I